MHDLAQEWLAKAEEDWDSARVLLGDESPLVTPALFHMQQCAEKLLKALLIKKKVYFERRHDLSYLLRLANEAELLCYSRLLNELNPFAVEIRYPVICRSFRLMKHLNYSRILRRFVKPYFHR